MKTLEILIGISGSGKSTYAKSQINKYTLIVSSDEIRKDLLGDINNGNHDFEILQLMSLQIKIALLGQRYSKIILDTTGLNYHNRMILLSYFRSSIDLAIIYRVFPCNVEKSLQRIDRQLKNREHRANINSIILLKQKKLYDETMIEILEESKQFNITIITHL